MVSKFAIRYNDIKIKEVENYNTLDLPQYQFSSFNVGCMKRWSLLLSIYIYFVSHDEMAVKIKSRKLVSNNSSFSFSADSNLFPITFC